MCKHSFADFAARMPPYKRHLTTNDFPQPTVEVLARAGASLESIHADVSSLPRSFKFLSKTNACVCSKDKKGDECAYGEYLESDDEDIYGSDYDFENEPETEDDELRAAIRMSLLTLGDGEQDDEDDDLDATVQQAFRKAKEELYEESAKPEIRGTWEESTPYTPDLDDDFPFWDTVIQLADNIITDRDTLPFWHGMIELADREKALGAQLPHHKRDMTVPPTRLLNAEQEKRTREYLDQYRHRLRVHFVEDLDDDAEDGFIGDAFTTLVSASTLHPDCPKGWGLPLCGYANGEVTVTREPFMQTFVSVHRGRNGEDWKQMTVANIRASIVKLALTVVHETAHALGNLILGIRSNGAEEPYVNGAMHSELGYALEQFLFGGQTIWVEGQYLTIVPWPNLPGIQSYAERTGMAARGIMMPEKVCDRYFYVDYDECERFLSADMWATSSARPDSKVGKAQRSTKERFDVLWDGVSPVSYRGHSVRLPHALQTDEASEGQSTPYEGSLGGALLYAAAVDRPFHRREFRLKKLRLMPYHEMPEDYSEYYVAKECDPDVAAAEPQAKKFKASVALAYRMKSEETAARKAEFAKDTKRVGRLQRRKEAKRQKFFDSVKPELDGLWSAIMEDSNKPFSVDGDAA